MRTEFQKQNMKKHIAFLEDNADKIRASFDMYHITHPCGSPSCSLGFIELSLDINRNNDEFIGDFSVRVLGVSAYNTESIYLFSSKWTHINNTPEAAAARMKAVLYNQVPIDWRFTKEYAHPIVITPEEILSESKSLQRV
jgi:hypothetical protein